MRPSANRWVLAEGSGSQKVGSCPLGYLIRSGIPEVYSPRDHGNHDQGFLRPTRPAQRRGAGAWCHRRAGDRVASCHPGPRGPLPANGRGTCADDRRRSSRDRGRVPTVGRGRGRRPAALRSAIVNLAPGIVVWVEFGAGRGREQAGRRPAVVVSSAEYLDVVDALAVVVPVTSRNRSWTNHIELTGDHGLGRSSWAITEQIQAVSRDRISRTTGMVDASCLQRIRFVLAAFLDLELHS